ncbi:MviM Predicted dehydrogenases and related proteins [Candidatus Nanopelagicaceae bacterium]
MKAAVIGCGLIGRKRAKAFPEYVELVGCFDEDTLVGESFATEFKTTNFTSLGELLKIRDLNFVIIATRHDSLHSLAIAALNAGKHVFIEKPGAINYFEFKKVCELARKKDLKVHVGYNHRHHPALRKAFELSGEGMIGEIMFLRGRYGHGGRLGYEREWRADKSKSGGGELIDQGTHLIDLSIGFLGVLQVDYAATPNYFWDTAVEDNVFMSLKNRTGGIAFLQASCTEWKNMFSLEIYGKIGKIEISGLGRSYGVEALTFHKMLPEMGPPLSETWSFPEPDESWVIEMGEFLNDLQTGASRSDNLDSSLEVLRVISEIYSRTGR